MVGIVSSVPESHMTITATMFFASISITVFMVYGMYCLAISLNGSINCCVSDVSVVVSSPAIIPRISVAADIVM